MEFGDVVLVVLSIIVGAFFTSLFLIVRGKKNIRKLVIRYIEIIVLIAPASFLVLQGDERLKSALMFAYNNVQIFSLGIPIVLYSGGFVVIAIMVYEVLTFLREEEPKEGPEGVTLEHPKRSHKGSHKEKAETEKMNK